MKIKTLILGFVVALLSACSGGDVGVVAEDAPAIGTVPPVLLEVIDTNYSGTPELHEAAMLFAELAEAQLVSVQRGEPFNQEVTERYLNSLACLATRFERIKGGVFGTEQIDELLAPLTASRERYQTFMKAEELASGKPTTTYNTEEDSCQAAGVTS